MHEDAGEDRRVGEDDYATHAWESARVQDLPLEPFFRGFRQRLPANSRAEEREHGAT